MELVEKEVSWVEASTLTMGCSIEGFGEHMDEMVDWQIKEDIDKHKAKK